MATLRTFAPENIGLPPVAEYVRRVNAALLAVDTVPKARAACGATTDRLGDGYNLIAEAPFAAEYDADVFDELRQRLDVDNSRLYALYERLPNDGSRLQDSDAIGTWLELVPVITNCYVDVYLVQFERRARDKITPFSWNPIELLNDSIRKLGSIAGQITESFGDAVTNAVKGAATGLWPVVLLVAVIVGGYFYVQKKGTLG